MLVLGIDPGFRNLGLALVDTSTGKVLATRTVDCGRVYLAMPKFVNRALEEMFATLPRPQRVRIEAAPFGYGGSRRGGQNACTMHWVLGVVGGWAARHDIPMSQITPKALKTFAAKQIGVPYKDWEGPADSRAAKKWGISQAVQQLTTGTVDTTDHEDDAILIAFTTT